MLISVVIPVDRHGADVDRAISAVLSQELASSDSLELILVGTPVAVADDPRVRLIEEPDRNPALRRNRGVAAARGEIIAFVDDDAFAEPRWIANALKVFAESAEIVAVGGPDPAPSDSPLSERISDLLLATPLIGSGIAAHEGRRKRFDLKSPHDIALVNLFVRRASFDAVGGFDLSIGYIGEDSDLLARLMRVGRIVYSPEVVVYHRRRAFPGAFLRQRWRYRTKTGAMMLSKDATYRRNPKIAIFLAAGFVFLVALCFFPLVALVMAAKYSIGTLLLGLRAHRIPLWMAPLIPLFFALHHAVYFVGIVWGVLKKLLMHA